MFWTNKQLRLRNARLEEEIKQEKENAERAWARCNDRVSEVFFLQSKVEELEKEKDLTLRVLAGIGPTLLAALGKSNG